MKSGGLNLAVLSMKFRLYHAFRVTNVMNFPHVEYMHKPNTDDKMHYREKCSKIARKLTKMNSQFRALLIQQSTFFHSAA